MKNYLLNCVGLLIIVFLCGCVAMNYPIPYNGNFFKSNSCDENTEVVTNCTAECVSGSGSCVSDCDMMLYYRNQYEEDTNSTNTKWID